MSVVACPVCGNQDLSFDGPGYLVDECQGQPWTPLVCDGPTERGGNGCGWRGTEEEAEYAWRTLAALESAQGAEQRPETGAGA